PAGQTSTPATTASPATVGGSASSTTSATAAATTTAPAKSEPPTTTTAEKAAAVPMVKPSVPQTVSQEGSAPAQPLQPHHASPTGPAETPAITDAPANESIRQFGAPKNPSASVVAGATQAQQAALPVPTAIAPTTAPPSPKPVEGAKAPASAPSTDQ